MSHTESTGATRTNHAANDTHRGANATTGTGQALTAFSFLRNTPPPLWVPMALETPIAGFNTFSNLRY